MDLKTFTLTTEEKEAMANRIQQTIVSYTEESELYENIILDLLNKIKKDIAKLSQEEQEDLKKNVQEHIKVLNKFIEYMESYVLLFDKGQDILEELKEKKKIMYRTLIYFY